MSLRSRPAAVLRGTGLALVAVIALFFVARAVVEVITVDPNQPASYERDWGGPHYLGVMLVHAGLGLLVLVVAVLWLWHSISRRRQRHHSR